MSQPAETPPSPFLDPAFPDDPYPAIDRLRSQEPVHWVPNFGFWFVTRHDDVKRLYNDPEYATPDRRVWENYVAPEEGSFMRWVSDNGLFSLPPAEHARVRKLVSASLTPRAVAHMEDQVREVIDRFAQPLHGRRGVVDLHSEFTDPIPNTVISRITGVPPAGDDEDRFRQLAQDTIRGFFQFVDPSLQKKGEDAFVELSSWVREMAKERRDSPREDMISDLVQATNLDDQLQTEEIVMLVSGLISAGSETTSIGGLIALRTLFDHPDAITRLRADRSLLPNAINEILRFGFGGPGGLPRYAVRDFELRGTQIRKGQMLMLSFGGASRDPAIYEDPHVFDIERDPRELLVFGNGPHYCLGANLARQELRCMLDAVLDFLPEAACYREDLQEVEETAMFRRPVNLPVDFGD